MIQPAIIRRRLEKLDEYLAILRQLQRYSYEEFAAPPHLPTSLAGAPL
jgi:hypothetical protein